MNPSALLAAYVGITGTEKDITGSKGNRNLHKTGLRPKSMSQHSHTKKMIPPWQTTSPVSGGGPGLGCWESCVHLRRYTCLRTQKSILRTFLFRNAEMSFCHEGFLCLPPCSSLRLNWRSQFRTVGEQSSPGCRGWLQPLLYQLGKGKSWNIPGSCCSALMHTSREAARTAGRNACKTAGMGQKTPVQGKSSTKGEFQSDLIGNNLLKAGNFHLNSVFISHFSLPSHPEGTFQGYNGVKLHGCARLMCYDRVWLNEPAYCSSWAQGAQDKPQWLQKSTHMHISVKPFSRKMSRTNKNLPHNTRIARWNKNPCFSKSSNGGKTIAGFVWY